jgi:hypothetical protein
MASARDRDTARSRAISPRCVVVAPVPDAARSRSMPTVPLDSYGAGAFATGNSMKLPLSPLSKTLMVAFL